MSFQWFCYHIYYYDNQDQLLKNGIFPLIADLENEKKMDGFFFLRYWEHGPHIRLRLHCDENTVAEVSDKLCTLINQYLQSYPSHFAISPQLYLKSTVNFRETGNETLNNTTMVPNNTLKIESYVPEFNKYGGEKGVAIAETVFKVSSVMIANIILKKNDYQKNRLGNAFLMMCIGVKAFQFDSNQIIEFFHLYHQYWSKYVHVQNWDDRYVVIKDQLMSVAKTCMLTNNIQDPNLKMWFECLSQTHHNLLLSDEIKNHIQLPSHLSPMAKTYYLLMNYLHTHNNRYGVLLHEEAFLGYLGLKTFQHLLETA